MTCAYFVSDLHLKSADDPNAKVFLSFLRQLRVDVMAPIPERPTHLFLVGDIFDLWVGAHSFFVRQFEDIVSAIEDLVKAGVSVHFFEGNHDLHLSSFWWKRLGVHVHTDSSYFDIAGSMIRVEHGDLINLNDRGYLFLRRVLRNPVIRFLILNLPSVLVSAIGTRASRASRQYTSGKGVSSDEIRNMIRAHAERVFAEKPFDLLFTGHVHLVDDQTMRVSGRIVRSVNLGSWFDQPRAFVLTGQRAEFIELHSKN